MWLAKKWRGSNTWSPEKRGMNFIAKYKLVWHFIIEKAEEEQMQNNSLIYHYTSIENLALILHNRTIRFTSLAEVNDLDEVETKEVEDIGKYCFVSCWTKSEEESIPLWNMYTPNMKGVRIALPRDMFDTSFDPNEKDIPKKKVLIPISIPVPSPEYIDVVYDDCVRKLWSNNTLDGNVLGKSKKPVWSFENECRFRLFLVPHDNKSRFVNLAEFNTWLKSYSKIINPKKICDFALRNDIVSEIEVLLGPKTSIAEQFIVDALAQKYGIKKVSKSLLRIRG